VHRQSNLQTQQPPHPLFVIKIGDPLFQQEHPPHHQQQRVLHEAAIYNATSAEGEGTFLRSVQVEEL
jgi:hypothetical protein